VSTGAAPLVLKRPRVLFVVGAYYPELSGGALQIRLLVQALGDRVESRVLTTSTLDTPGPADVDGIPVRRVHVDVARPSSLANAGVGLAAAFVRLAPHVDIVQFTGFSRKTVLLIALATALRKRRVIRLTSVGDDDPPAIRSRGALTFAAYRRADVFVGISPRQRDLCLTSGIPSDRFILIPNGVDTTRFRPAATEEERARLRRVLGLPAGISLTLFVGFFSREKQPHVLFEAWRRLPRAQAGGLVFVGATQGRYHEIDSTLAARIREESRAAGVAERVVLVERTDEIEQYYRAVDAFVLPSLREGSPNALLEAMATGLPCLVSRLPGVTDWIVEDGRSGLLVPPGDVEALAAGLARLRAEPVLPRALGAAARAAVVDRHAVERTADAYLSLYRRLLSPTLAAVR
jgi:glycosyltransferase involved in cell wall biosynthesis